MGFRMALTDSAGVRVHPTPLYELAAALLIGCCVGPGRKQGDRLDVGEYLVLTA